MLLFQIIHFPNHFPEGKPLLVPAHIQALWLSSIFPFLSPGVGSGDGCDVWWGHSCELDFGGKLCIILIMKRLKVTIFFCFNTERISCLFTITTCLLDQLSVKTEKTIALSNLQQILKSKSILSLNKKVTELSFQPNKIHKVHLCLKPFSSLMARMSYFKQEREHATSFHMISDYIEQIDMNRWKRICRSLSIWFLLKQRPRSRDLKEESLDSRYTCPIPIEENCHAITSNTTLVESYNFQRYQLYTIETITTATVFDQCFVIKNI